MKAELDTKKASFKLDLIETANADPLNTGSDLKLLAAYVAVMEWPSTRAWLATPLAMAMTGLSERQVRASRARLTGKRDEHEEQRAYLKPARSRGRVLTFDVINPWRDEARRHVEMLFAFHKEAERQKKASKRTDLSRQNLPGQEEVCPGKIRRSVPAEFAAYSPLRITPREEGSREIKSQVPRPLTDSQKSKRRIS